MNSLKAFFGVKSHPPVENKLSNEVPNDKRSQIFKLDIDCFEEIFDYLSLNDLHSFGETCKDMQQVTGEYFRRNYIGAEKYTNDDGIYTVCAGSDRVKISGFNEYINYTSHYHNENGPFRYINLHCDEFSTINEIYLVCCEINETTVTSLRSILPKIETVRIRQCSIVGDFYDKLLQFCGNLKAIYVQDDRGDIVKERSNPWLLREYPSLETFQLTARNSFKVKDLATFLERNNNIRTFLTTSGCLWKHGTELAESNAQIDTLDVCDSFEIQTNEMQTFCDLLNRLYERGFYKRLRLNVKGSNQECGNEFASLKALESISLLHFSPRSCLFRLADLKELTICERFNANDMELIARNLTQLRRLCLSNATVNDILPFIKYSVKLHKIQTNLVDNVLDLEKFNEERSKVIGARKIIIYIPDNNFLATKWNTKNGNTRLSHVEIRRSTSEQ